MESTKEIRDDIGRAHERGEEILREAREKGWTDDRHAEFDKTHAHLGELRQTLEAITKQAEARSVVLDKREERKDGERNKTTGKALAKARERDIEEGGSYKRFAKWARAGWAGLNADDMALYAAECRALNTGVGAEGGFLVPTDMMNSITEALLAFGGMRQANTTVLRTRAGNPLTIPQNNDTANPGQIILENAAAQEADPVFTELILGAFKYSSDVVRVSLELLDDNEIDDFEGFLGRMLGVRIGRVQNTDFTLGVGTTEPVGVVPASALGVTTGAGQVDTITKDNFIDLIHSVDPGYGNTPTAQFMMNYLELGNVRKLDTTEGLPIWNDAQLNTPPRLYGHEIIVNQDMVDAAAATVPVLFGDFSTYLIREVWPIRVTRTTELFWLESQIGLMAVARADGALNNAGTDPIKHILMAAV